MDTSCEQGGKTPEHHYSKKCAVNGLNDEHGIGIFYHPKEKVRPFPRGNSDLLRLFFAKDVTLDNLSVDRIGGKYISLAEVLQLILLSLVVIENEIYPFM